MNFLIFGLLKVKFNIFDGLVIQLYSFSAWRYKRLEIGDLNDRNSLADELFVEIVLMIHFLGLILIRKLL